MSFLPFTPNFSTTHSVFLPNVTLEASFTILGTGAGIERACRLTELCSGFETLELDTVVIPHGKDLDGVSVRTQPPLSSSPTSGSKADKGDEVATGLHAQRQHFHMEETVPVLFGLITTKVQIEGTFTWLEPSSSAPSSPRFALYESQTNGPGILVWKCRKFEEVVESTQEGRAGEAQEGGVRGTRVSEEIQGWAPVYLKHVVQSKAAEGHRAHMESYHTLFDS